MTNVEVTVNAESPPKLGWGAKLLAPLARRIGPVNVSSTDERSRLRGIVLDRSWRLLNEGGILVVALSPVEGSIGGQPLGSILRFMVLGLVLWVMGLILEWLIGEKRA
jgi:hypothetical protein